MLQALGTPSPSASPSPVDQLREIAPPVEVFPYATWQVVLAAALALGLLVTLGWLLVHWWRQRPGPALPSPRQRALAELAQLRAQVESMAPQAFSFAVSEVVRRYVEGEYQVRALKQTTPEFLAAIAATPCFSAADRALLTEFGERTDLIKFAGQQASPESSRELLDSASRLVQGGLA